MKKYTLGAFATLLIAVTAWAIVPQRLQRDIQLPTQVMLEHQTWTTPIVATTNYIKTTYAGPTSAATLTLSSFSHQPDVPRVITVTPTGTTGDVEACGVTIVGTNSRDAVIGETVSFLADASTAQTTTAAFKTITSVNWQASCESGGFAATWIIGVGTALGMQHCAAAAGDYVFSKFDGAYETTRGTMVANASSVAKNVFSPNGTMNAAKDVELHYIQNYACP